MEADAGHAAEVMRNAEETLGASGAGGDEWLWVGDRGVSSSRRGVSVSVHLALAIATATTHLALTTEPAMTAADVTVTALRLKPSEAPGVMTSDGVSPQHRTGIR